MIILILMIYNSNQATHIMLNMYKKKCNKKLNRNKMNLYKLAKRNIQKINYVNIIHQITFNLIHLTKKGPNLKQILLYFNYIFIKKIKNDKIQNKVISLNEKH